MGDSSSVHGPLMPCVLLVFAARAAWCRSSFHWGRAGNRHQLAAVHALVDAQLAAVLQHAYGYPGNVARIVQAGVRAALVLQAQLLQHGAQLRLDARDLREENMVFGLVSHSALRIKNTDFVVFSTDRITVLCFDSQKLSYHLTSR